MNIRPLRESLPAKLVGGLKLPTCVEYLGLNGLTSAEGLNLPESVLFEIRLDRLAEFHKEALRQRYPELADKIK